jgi:hypothetical protein
LFFGKNSQQFIRFNTQLTINRCTISPRGILHQKIHTIKGT